MTTQEITPNSGVTAFQAVTDDAAATAAAIDLITILDTIDAPVVVMRRDFTVAYFNKATADALGLLPADIGRASHEISALAGVPRLEQRCSQVIASGMEARIDFRAADKRFVVRICPHTKSDREFSGVVLTFANVTAFRAGTDQAIYERECTKAILNTVADPLVVLSADQRIQSGNRAFYTMFAVSRDDTQGIPLYELGNGAFVALRTQLKEVLAGGQTFKSVEVDHVIAGKGQRTLLLDAHPLSFPGHFERRVLVTFQDITARKQAALTERQRSAEELQRSEAQLADARRELQLTIDTIPAMVATFRPDGERDFVNKTWRDYFGQTSQQTPGEPQSYVIRLHPDDADAVTSVWRASLASGQPFQMEMRIFGNDGRYRWHTVRRVPLRNENGEIVKWYGVMVDIEEQKAAENALRRSEAYLAEAQRLAHTGSWATDYAERRPIHSSEEHHRLFGFDPAGGTPPWRDWMERIHPDDRAMTREIIERSSREKADFEMDYRVCHPDGTIKYLHVVGHPVLNKAGDVVEFVGTSVDMTERRQAEESRQDAQNKLAHANRVATMGHLTASIAHEINQPIGAALAYANAALNWLDPERANLEEARRAIGRIVEAGIRAGDVIDRTRALVKKAPPRKDRVDVNEALLEIVELTRGETAKNAISVQVELAEQLPAIEGDRVQLQQVILNLLINAIEAMSASEGLRNLKISTGESEPDGVLVAVRDSGPGLAPDSADWLFDPFYTTKTGGLGMGLSISRSIVEAHQGKLWAGANTPEGTVFQFTLPAYSDAEKNDC